jgi:antitoxin CptB
MPESQETRRKRLKFRSAHRGIKELDLLLGGFAAERLDSLDAAQLDRFEALLAVPEPQLYAWLSGREAPGPEHDHDVMAMLRAYRFAPRVR